MIELACFETRSLETSITTSGRVSVDARIVEHQLQLVYRFSNWASPLILGARSISPQRRDGLWRTTCAEIFVALDPEKPAGGPYLEFNFSPTGDWAAYRFDAPREGMRPHDWPGGSAPTVVGRGSSEDFTLQALVPLAALSAGSCRVAYASVVESASGLSYWALKHPSDRPDFHHPESFVVSLELPA